MNYCIIHRRFILLHELQQGPNTKQTKKLYSDDQKFARYPITKDLQLSNRVPLHTSDRLSFTCNKVTLFLLPYHMKIITNK